ncbi:ABC transporter permease [Paractinoplanes maris]|uniref:ABC transporter permease n=1 Tax=Paractinoplanes maris TaxID=1734446 RepID=UPI002021E81B|nr:ABC transporter permease [Actinoplanes maris]
MTLSAGEFAAEPVPTMVDEAQGPVAGRSPWQIARARLRANRVAMIALFMIIFFVVIAIAAPILQALGVIDTTTLHPELVQGPGAMPTGSFGGISIHHPLGVEPQTGRDLFSRILLGITLDTAIAVAATIISVGLGVVLGLVAGFYRGAADWSIGRLIDLILAFPQLLMLIALSPVLVQRITDTGVPQGNPSKITYIIAVLGFFGWPYFARIIRAQVLSLREREFVEAAEMLGARRSRINFKELLPNLWAPILVYSSIVLPTYVSAEAAMSFLGVGIVPPTPTLGNLLQDSVNYATADPTYFLAPGLTLFIVVLAFNLFGDGLRDALDPRSDRAGGK